MRVELRRYFVLAYFALAMALSAWARWRRTHRRREIPDPWAL